MILSRNAPGTRHQFPLLTRRQNPGQNLETVDMVLGANPSEVFEGFEDFDGGLNEYQLSIPIGTIATSAAAYNGVNVVPRSGYVTAAYFVASEALATSDTNYITFTTVNRLGSGSGSTAMLAASDANTTKATGGSALTAKSARALTLNGTAANLRVAAGDTIEGIATVTAGTSLANDVEDGVIVLRIATIPSVFTPRITRTAGSPLVGPVEDTIAGEVVCQLSGTDENTVAGFDFGDRLCLQGNKQPFFEARVKISAATADTRYVFGLASAYNATFDSTTYNAWFRIEGADLSLKVEVDDNTSATLDDQDTGIDLTADTYVRLGVALTDLGNVAFFVDGALVKLTALDMGDISTGMLQPVLYVQKDSAADPGTNTNSFTVDYVRWGCNRR